LKNELFFHPEAETEFIAAIDYYEENNQGLAMILPENSIQA
jgi:hypothetical protein